MEKDLETKITDQTPEKTIEKPEVSAGLSEDRLKFQLSGWEIREETEKLAPSPVAVEAAPLKEKFKEWDHRAANTEVEKSSEKLSETQAFETKSEAFRADAAQVLADIQDQLSSTNTITSTRAKSSQRLRYEAEIAVLKRKLGGLEEIREKLGLSQRKICQLLMVDPSAWTRWTKEGENAPPHIYRALQWYLALEEKYPALDVNFWLQTVARTTSAESIAARTEIEALEGKLEDVKQNFASQSLTIMDRAFAEIKTLKEEVEILRKRSLFINTAILAAAFLFIAGFLWSRLI